MKRCGQCKNCLKLKKVQRAVLRCVNPPFNHADDDIIQVWNDQLKQLPCLNPPGTTTS